MSVPRIIPKTLRAGYGSARGDAPDLHYSWGEGCCRTRCACYEPPPSPAFGGASKEGLRSKDIQILYSKTMNTRMTEDEQRKAIAIACGWTAVECTVCGKPGFVAKTPEGATLWRGEGGYDAGSVIANNCPNFTGDLNACAEMERALKTTKQQNAYQANIAEICFEDQERADNQVVFNQLTATAAQRCEAFLRTVGKWRE